VCGIAGAIGHLDPIDTSAMLDAIAHRGPDDQGEIRDSQREGIGSWLGHRRLAIIDPTPSGHQPMTTRDGRYSIVFNGEIYNFREIQSSLAGFVPQTRSDTEVLLELLVREGTAGLPKLRGMFAIALWDAHERRLLLARDRLGEKPLYFYQDKHRFVFASEVRALLASDAVPREMDDDGLDSFLTFGTLADPYTLVAGVRAVIAGGYVEHREGVTLSGDYWRISDIEVDPDLSRAESVSLVRERLRESVSRCMVSDVPVGLLLSGGIDSSANVVMLDDLERERPHTFSVVFDDADDGLSEETYASLVAERFETVHSTIRIGFDEAREYVAEAVAAQDQPSHDALNTYLVSQAIHRAGLKVAISGQGGDELFLGYHQRANFGRLLQAARFAPRSVGRLLERSRRRKWDGRDGAVEKLLQLASAPDAVGGAYLTQHSVFSRSGLERLRGGPRPHPCRFVERVGGDSPLDRLSRLQIRHYLKNTLLRDADQMSMAVALELRGPFLDADLVEAALRVPSAWKVEPERNKPILLDAVGQKLPREVWDRPKQGFALPMSRWLRAGLRVAEGEAPGLDPDACKAVRSLFHRSDATSPYDYARCWSLEVLTAWAHEHRMGTSLLS
jgi:asparagine synthase (glutamine-hydrolysing)